MSQNVRTAKAIWKYSYNQRN